MIDISLFSNLKIRSSIKGGIFLKEKKVIQIKMFKGFKICVDGVWYDLNEYLSKQLLNLLQLLVVNHDREVVKQEMYDALWSTSENPRNVMKFTIFRLRNDLKKIPCFQDIEFIETGKQGYRLTQAFTYDLDLDKFMQLNQKISSYDEFGIHEVNIGKQMITLYEGKVFMTNSCLPWIEAVSETYRKLFATTVIRICRYLMNENRYEEMITLNYNAILKEPFYEGLHYYHMKGLIHTKDYHRALQYYDEINETFYHELGTGLSSKFEELYEMIAEKRQEHQSVSMKQLLENLNKTSKKTGGFYCTFELFKHIYEVSLLSAKRDHKDYYIILFELQGCHDLEKQIEIMNRLKNIIMRSLRSSDIFTKVNLTQFALLISCVEEHNTQLVIRRITSLFYKRYARNLYQLSYEVVAVNDMIEHKGEKLL